MKKIASLALALVVCITLVNFPGCRHPAKKKDKKTTKTVERTVDVKNVDIKKMDAKELAGL